MPTEEELLTIDELADKLKRSRRYVEYMRYRGFKMPGGRATLKEALKFLSEVTTPCVNPGNPGRSHSK